MDLNLLERRVRPKLTCDLSIWGTLDLKLGVQGTSALAAFPGLESAVGTFKLTT